MHGTHVLDIAADNGQAASPAGIAPEADLIFVHLADRTTGGLRTSVIRCACSRRSTSSPARPGHGRA